MIIFTKAVDRHDTQTMALFVTPTMIDGYVKKDGTVVKPHVARRPHAVHVRRIGLLTSLIAAYDRAHEERVARAKRVDAWVGKVGERREFDAVFSGLHQFDTAFGVMFVARFDSPEGLLVYKGGTIWWPTPLEIGTPIKFVGTIKEHADYKGTKQTLVSRCALPKEKPVKAKKAAVAA